MPPVYQSSQHFSLLFPARWDHVEGEEQTQEIFSVAQNVSDEDSSSNASDSDCAAASLTHLHPGVIVRMKVEVEEMSKVRLRSEQVLGVIPASQAADCASADLAVVMN